MSNSALPLPPKEYNVEYMTRLIRQLSIFIGRLNAEKPVYGKSDLSRQVVGYPISALTLYDIPTSPTDLPSGSVWSDGGTLKIVS